MDKNIYNEDVDELLINTDLYLNEEYERCRSLNSDQNTRSLSKMDKKILNQVINVLIKVPINETPLNIYNNYSGGPFVDVYIHTFISPLNNRNQNRTNIENEINHTMMNVLGRNRSEERNRIIENIPDANNIQINTIDQNNSENNNLLGRKREADESITIQENNNVQTQSQNGVYEMMIEEYIDGEENQSSKKNSD